MKLYALEDHQNKSAAYAGALTDAGYSIARHLSSVGVRFLLTDADWREDLMTEAYANSIPVFLYPHAARPMVQYDGCVEPRTVRAMFAQAPGGAELMKRIGYPNPVVVTGWAFSEVRPFQPVGEVKHIIFAPIHPNANGYLHQVDKDLNRRTLAVLKDYCLATGASLSIRYIGNPDQCGIPELGWICSEYADQIEAHKGKKNNSTWDMDNADVVVAHQTYAYMAVALGKPCVMMGEDVPPRSGNTDKGFCYVKHWPRYKDYLMYPLDILQGDPAETIAKACAGSREADIWRERFIGEPFDGKKFVKELEALL